MTDKDVEKLRWRLADLRSKHRELDDEIVGAIEAGPFDQLLMQRLKRRKLALKDEIARLESQLLPDIIA